MEMRAQQLALNVAVLVRDELSIRSFEPQFVMCGPVQVSLDGVTLLVERDRASPISLIKSGTLISARTSIRSSRCAVGTGVPFPATGVDGRD